MDPAPAVTKQAKADKPARRRKSAVATPASVSGEQAAVRTDRRAARKQVEVRKVDLWSVLKVSLCFYLAGLVVLLVAGIVAWLLVDAAGGIHNFEDFMGELLSANDYRIIGGQLLLGAALVGLVLVALATILTTLAAALFNVFSELVGGVEVTLVDAE
jgi:hypothetical protein